jgi:hypothetical protein
MVCPQTVVVRRRSVPWKKACPRSVPKRRPNHPKTRSVRGLFPPPAPPPPKTEVCPLKTEVCPLGATWVPGLFPREWAFAWSVPGLSAFAESPARDRPSVSEGFAQNIAHGILRGRYRNSLLKPELMEVGVVYETRVDLGPVAAKLGAGQKLRVEMSGADFPAL